MNYLYRILSVVIVMAILPGWVLGQKLPPSEQISPVGVWELEEEHLYSPRTISFVSKYLVITDDNPDNQIAIFNPENRQYLGSFGRKGRGPTEFTGLWQILSDPTNPFFCAHDIQLRRITCFDIDQIIEDDLNAETELSVSLNGDFGNPLNIAADLTKREFIVTGIFSDHSRFAFSDHSGNLLFTAGEIPEIMADAPINVRQNAAIVRPVINPSTGKIAMVSRFTNRIEFYSSSGEQLQVLEYPRTSFDPDLTISYTEDGQPYMTQSGETSISYTDVHADSDFLYAIYSGRKRKNGAASMGNKIFKFNWKGELLARFQLETFIQNCTLGQTSGTLLCLEYNIDGRQRILEYDLSADRD